MDFGTYTCKTNIFNTAALISPHLFLFTRGASKYRNCFHRNTFHDVTKESMTNIRIDVKQRNPLNFMLRDTLYILLLLDGVGGPLHFESFVRVVRV